MAITITPKQKLLLVGPGLALPFAVMFFWSLGGGKGAGKPAASVAGLNKLLPNAQVGTATILENKLNVYKKADADSAKKATAVQRDPYRTHSDSLVQQLNRLQESLRRQGAVGPVVPLRTMPVTPPVWGPEARLVEARLSEMRVPDMRRRVVDTPTKDPQLDRLDAMLDKVMRIQHPGEVKKVGAENVTAEVVWPADSASNAIAAVIPTDQTLVSGGTVALRLMEDVTIHGQTIARGQWVYGTVSINNDRMPVHVRSIRDGRNLYNTDLQVYDMDGLGGIHIPGMLSRDVAKESADESVGGLNVTTYDGSLESQAANAGIQAAKLLVGRKVRLVRVGVRAGYEVLLRNGQGKVGVTVGRKNDVLRGYRFVRPPGIVPGGPFLERCRAEGMELDLQGIYLQDSLLWVALRWTNHSVIGYAPEYCRWVIRDRHAVRRTAEQEVALEPEVLPVMGVVAGDSSVDEWTGFRPFALGKDKEFVVEVGERNGGRVLQLIVNHKEILHAKRCQTTR